MDSPDDFYSPRIALTPTNPPTTPQPLPIDMDPDYHTATLVGNERITADDWTQDVRHFEFKFDDDISYNPGDSALIHPSASLSDVQTLLDLLGWPDADTPFLITHTHHDQSLPTHLPKITTLRDILTHNVHITATPRRGFFELLRQFAPPHPKPDVTTTERERDFTTERERLEEFLGSDEGADDLHAYAFQPHRTILEVLSEFRDTARRIPKEYVFDIFPPLRGREFSIASSVLVEPKRVELCVAIVNYRTKLKIPRRDVCTTWLASLPLGTKIRIKITKGLVNLPSLDVPVICVGPGTGVAPMRAIIQHRLQARSPSASPLRGETRLYFGCRHASKDQHYKSEFAEYEQVGENRVFYRVACSRDGPEGEKRTYVQDLMGEPEDARRIWKLLGMEGGYIFISGSSNKMPAAIRATLKEIAIKEGGIAEDEAREWVAGLERCGRLVEECWS